MKKLLCLAAYLGIGLTAMAQGTVLFNNIGSTNLVINSFTGMAQAVSPADNLVLALYGGTNGASEATLVQLGLTAVINPAPGLFSGGTRTNNAVAGGTPGVFQVRAWDSSFGLTYEDFLVNAPPSAQNGKSALFTSNTASGINPPVNLASTFPGLTLIPEPTTYALVAAGAGLIWLTRRRRDQS